MGVLLHLDVAGPSWAGPKGEAEEDTPVEGAGAKLISRKQRPQITK